MAFSQNMTLKEGFPNHNSLDKKIIVYVMFPLPPPIFCFVLGFGIFVGLFFETGYVCPVAGLNVLCGPDWL